MIPYILAENPKIQRKKAFKLSKEMMKGNKWKTFILDLSFLGWELLSIFTFGLLNIFYINPYKVATTVELYEVLKKQIISQKSEYYEELNSLELINTLFSEVNPIPVKEALNILGFNFGNPRLPLVEMSETAKVKLKQAIEKFAKIAN